MRIEPVPTIDAAGAFAELRGDPAGVLGRLGRARTAVLLQPPQVPLEALDVNTARNHGYFAYPPQGLLYLSAALRAKGLATSIVDLNYVVLEAVGRGGLELEAVWQSAVRDAIERAGEPLICVSYMFDATRVLVEGVCAFVRRNWPELVVMAGGVGATAEPTALLETGLADLVVSHEAESSLDKIFEYARGEAEALPPNLSLRVGGGPVLQTPMQAGGGDDLDIRTEFSLVPIRHYHRVGSLNSYSRMIGTEVPYATILSRRGCRARCTFCSVRRFNGKGVRQREASGVVDEMLYLHDRHGIRHFDWLDDDLLWDKPAVLELFDAIATRLPDVTWSAHNGLIASSIDREIMDAIDRSRCVGFTVGLESGNAEVLHRVKKPTTLPQFFAFAKMMRDYPRQLTGVNFILGFPGETFGQMLDSFTAALRARLDWSKFFLYQPLRNTDLFAAYGNFDAEVEAIGAGDEGQRAEYIPAREKSFYKRRASPDVLTGFDILELPRDLHPTRRQTTEIWVLFNYVTNFVRHPALTEPHPERLSNTIRWVRGLVQAFPDNPAMECLLHALLQRDRDGSPAELEGLRRQALAKFETSEYWRDRDREYHFSALLEGVVPELDSRVAPLLQAIDAG